MNTIITFLTILYITSASKLSSEDLCQGADPSETSYFPYEGDCSRYIECFNDVPTIFQCSEGLWWHQEITDCDYPGDYCTDSTAPTTEGPTVVTSPGSTIPPVGPGSDPRCVDGNTAYWPHPILCNRYIECYEGNSYEMSCPPGLYFSDSLKECVDPTDSECV